MFIVNGRCLYSCKVLFLTTIGSFAVTYNDKLNGESWGFEPGITFQVLKLDVELVGTRIMHQMWQPIPIAIVRVSR